MANRTHGSKEKTPSRRPPARPAGSQVGPEGAAARSRGPGAAPAALSPGELLVLQRAVGNQSVAAILAQRAERVPADSGAVSLEKDAPPAAVALTKKEVAAFFKGQLQADFKGKGIADYFSLGLTVFKKTKLPKGASALGSIEACWQQLAAAIKGLTSDTRKFRQDLVLQLPEGSRPPYLQMRVTLSRRDVTAAEQPTIESNLTDVDTAYAYGGKKGKKLEKSAYKAYQQLYKAAEAAGLMKSVPDLFKIVSDYRSVTEQETLFKNKCDSVAKAHPDWTPAQVEAEARQWVAKPGGSAHHTGRAVDLYMGWSIGSANAKTIQDKKSKLYKDYGKYWDWLKANAPAYGFLPYAAEPWHWEAWLA